MNTLKKKRQHWHKKNKLKNKGELRLAPLTAWRDCPASSANSRAVENKNAEVSIKFLEGCMSPVVPKVG